MLGAIADAILNNKPYNFQLKKYYQRYPRRGYGGNFHSWASSKNLELYNSWGNGSAMRVSAVGYAFNELETVLLEAKKSAEVTHNHPEGIKGALGFRNFNNSTKRALVMLFVDNTKN